MLSRTLGKGPRSEEKFEGTKMLELLSSSGNSGLFTKTVDPSATLTMSGRSHTVAGLSSNSLLTALGGIAGGSTDAQRYPLSLQRYNLANGSVSNPASPRSYVRASGCQRGDKLYVTNAIMNGVDSSEMFSYDLLTGTTAALAQSPFQPRTLCAMAPFGNDFLMMAGGALNGVSQNTCAIYRVSSNTWVAGANMPADVHSAPAVLGSDGKIYVPFGWSSTASANRRSVMIYDPATSQWSQSPNMPSDVYTNGLSSYPAVAAGNYILYFAFDVRYYKSALPEYLNSMGIIRYNIVTQKFDFLLVNGQQVRRNYGMAVKSLDGSKVYVFGGAPNTGSTVSDDTLPRRIDGVVFNTSDLI